MGISCQKILYWFGNDPTTNKFSLFLSYAEPHASRAMLYRYEHVVISRRYVWWVHGVWLNFPFELFITLTKVIDLFAPTNVLLPIGWGVHLSLTTKNEQNMSTEDVVFMATSTSYTKFSIFWE